jgi:hypothetical protein
MQVCSPPTSAGTKRVEDMKDNELWWEETDRRTIGASLGTAVDAFVNLSNRLARKSLYSSSLEPKSVRFQPNGSGNEKKMAHSRSPCSFAVASSPSRWAKVILNSGQGSSSWSEEQEKREPYVMVSALVRLFCRGECWEVGLGPENRREETDGVRPELEGVELVPEVLALTFFPEARPNDLLAVFCPEWVLCPAPGPRS